MNPNVAQRRADSCHRVGRVSEFGHSGLGAFTLIELMVAMAIASMMLLIAIPSIRGVRKPPQVRATEDFVKGCREARARAILTGRPMQLVIDSQAGMMRVESAPTVIPTQAIPDGPGSPDSGYSAPRREAETKTLFSAHLPDEVAFRKLVINLRNVFDAREQVDSGTTVAFVRFYPNGTSDDLLAEIMVDQSEVFRVTLDVIVGAPTVIAVP
jgi:prepilin-type N-terminal cleavage/methylation domain-containing protein